MTRPAKFGRKGLTCLLYSDIVNLIYSMQASFPEIVKVESIGNSFLNNSIMMVTLDAREYIIGEMLQ